MEERVAQKQRSGKYPREEQSQVLKGSHFPHANQRSPKRIVFPWLHDHSKRLIKAGGQVEWWSRAQVPGSESKSKSDLLIMSVVFNCNTSFAIASLP